MKLAPLDKPQESYSMAAKKGPLLHSPSSKPFLPGLGDDGLLPGFEG